MLSAVISVSCRSCDAWRSTENSGLLAAWRQSVTSRAPAVCMTSYAVVLLFAATLHSRMDHSCRTLYYTILFIYNHIVHEVQVNEKNNDIIYRVYIFAIINQSITLFASSTVTQVNKERNIPTKLGTFKRRQRDRQT